MINAIRNFVKRQDTIEKRLFWIVFLIEIFVTAISGLFTYFEDLSAWATFSCFFSWLLVLVIGVISSRLGGLGEGYLGMYLVLGIVLLPAAFFFCGGVRSGMPMYCSALILVGAVAPVRFLSKFICFIIVFLWMGASMALSISDVPLAHMLLTEVDDRSAGIDVVASYFIMAFTIFCIGAFVVESYNRERHRREALLAKLDFLSKHDSLTGLYNRSYLLHYLENMVWARRDKFHLCIFNVDDYVELVDANGHSFGDRMTRTIGELLARTFNADQGECGALYGESTFAYIVYGDNEMDAYVKADHFREAVASLQWEGHSDVAVTVSGAITACAFPDDFDRDRVMKKVDFLLDASRSRGKNQFRHIPV